MNILLAVDDNPDRTLMREMVAQEPGHDVTEVFDGDEAWTMLREPGQTFDLAILDLAKPPLDGLGVAERIRTLPALRTLPIVLCTTVKDRQAIQRAAQLGIRHYVVKPFAPEALTAKIRAVAAEKAARAGDDNSEQVARRLGVPASAVKQLIAALYGKVREWLDLARQAQTPQEFVRVTIEASRFRSACANLELRTLAQELELVEAKFTRNYCEQHGDMLAPSPLEIADELKGVEAELARIAARAGLHG